MTHPVHCMCHFISICWFVRFSCDLCCDLAPSPSSTDSSDLLQSELWGCIHMNESHNRSLIAPDQCKRPNRPMKQPKCTNRNGEKTYVGAKFNKILCYHRPWLRIFAKEAGIHFRWKTGKAIQRKMPWTTAKKTTDEKSTTKRIKSERNTLSNCSNG